MAQAILGEYETDTRQTFFIIWTTDGFFVALPGFTEKVWFGPFTTKPEALENAPLVLDCESVKEKA